MKGVIGLVGAIFACGQLHANEIVTADLERFAALFQQGTLSANVLQTQYINNGSTGIEIYTPYRIVNGQNLASAISKNPAYYQRAIDFCLPLIEKNKPTMQLAAKQVQQLLGYKQSATTYFVFGANNSGGTANENGLALGLEKNCQFINNENEFADYFSYMIAHELVHVYQGRYAVKPKTYTILYQSLREGVPELIAELTVNKRDTLATERNNYGLANHARLKRDFAADMHAPLFSENSKKANFRGWMYGESKNNMPKDMAYWMGFQIAKAYYNQANNKQAALQTLIELNNPTEIVKQSGYFE